MSTLTIELSDELRERLEAASASRKVPPAQLVLDYLETLPSKQPPEAEGQSAYDVLKEYFGCVDSGVTDLATNPKYLEGYGR